MLYILNYYLFNDTALISYHNPHKSILSNSHETGIVFKLFSCQCYPQMKVSLELSFDDGETVETVSDFNFLVSKITADGDCSHEIKRCLLLGRKVMTNLDSILKSRDITLPTKVCLVKVMVFPVVKYGCESWTVKKAECQRTDDFELWCWRTLESPLDCMGIQ